MARKSSPKLPVAPGVVLARLDLPGLLDEKDVVPQSIAALIEGLQACRTYPTPDGPCTEPDHATRIKAAQALLAYAVGEPVKRQQILSAALPVTPPSQAELTETIDRKIAALLGEKAVTLQSLVAARKAMSGASAKESAGREKLTEEEIVAKAREIHGIL